MKVMLKTSRKFIGVLFLLVLFRVAAQETMHLPLETGVWKQELVSCTKVYDGVSEHEEINRYYYDYYKAGDTIINEIKYAAIFKTDDGIIGAIRQDSNRVYYRPLNGSGNNEEVVLYDFNVSDIFTINTFNNREISFNVVKIDSVNINGLNRKRIEFDDEEGLFIGKYWIEGIGSSGGLLKPFYPTDIPTCLNCCGVVENLVCLKTNDELLFLKDNYFDCDSILTSHKKTLDFRRLEIIVKESNLLSVNTNSSNKIRLIEISNVLGQLILRQKVNHLTQFQMRLDYNGLNIIKVYTDNGTKSKKVLINNKR